jgi:hypothetical protein
MISKEIDEVGRLNTLMNSLNEVVSVTVVRRPTDT